MPEDVDEDSFGDLVKQRTVSKKKKPAQKREVTKKGGTKKDGTSMNKKTKKKKKRNSETRDMMGGSNSAGMSWNIVVDTPGGHGEPFRIVEAIEVYSDEESSCEDTQQLQGMDDESYTDSDDAPGRESESSEESDDDDNGDQSIDALQAVFGVHGVAATSTLLGDDDDDETEDFDQFDEQLVERTALQLNIRKDDECDAMKPPSLNRHSSTSSKRSVTAPFIQLDFAQEGVMTRAFDDCTAIELSSHAESSQSQFNESKASWNDSKRSGLYPPSFTSSGSTQKQMASAQSALHDSFSTNTDDHGVQELPVEQAGPMLTLRQKIRRKKAPVKSKSEKNSRPRSEMTKTEIKTDQKPEKKKELKKDLKKEPKKDARKPSFGQVLGRMGKSRKGIAQLLDEDSFE